MSSIDGAPLFCVISAAPEHCRWTLQNKIFSLQLVPAFSWNKYPIRGYWDDVLFVLMVVARQFGDVKHYLHQPTVSC